MAMPQKRPVRLLHAASTLADLLSEAFEISRFSIEVGDAHGNLPREHESQCKDIDQGCAGLIMDLKQRGMLDDTLVIWGGEFGRTAYCQGGLTKENYGRDHHPRCFTTWMAGGRHQARHHVREDR